MSFISLILISFAVASRASIPDRHGSDSKLWPCPNAADIAPCVCTADLELNLDMDCSNAADEAQLASVFSANFPVTAFRRFMINYPPVDNYDTLFDGVFSNVTFQLMYVWSTNVRVVEEGALSNMFGTLKQIDFYTTRLESFPFQSLASFVSLDVLYLSNNYIANIPDLSNSNLLYLSLSSNADLQFSPTAFNELTVLESIHLHSVNLQQIPDNLFAQASPQLKIVDLAFNNLTVLQSGAIVTQTPSLTSIHLGNSNIATVEQGAIQGLTTNGTLYMHANSIQSLNQTVWQPIFDQILSGIDRIDLADNPLDCACDIEWVVDNPTYLYMLTSDSLCFDGTPVHTLDPNVFDAICH